MIDKKILRKNIIIIVLIVIIGVIAFKLVETFARYSSSSSSEAGVNVAFWFIGNSVEEQQEKRIILEKLQPSTEYQVYSFSISNNNGTKTAQTDIRYQIDITTTTNLPLNYYLYKRIDSSLAEGTNDVYTYTDSEGNEYKYKKLDISQVTNADEQTGNYFMFTTDSDGTYYRDMTYTTDERSNMMILEKSTNTTENFLICVEFPLEYNSSEYSDLIDVVELKVTANQLLDGESSV